MAGQARWIVVYEMKNGTEQRQPVYNDDELKHERAAAEMEVHSRDTYVAGYRVEYPTEQDQAKV